MTSDLRGVAARLCGKGHKELTWQSRAGELLPSHAAILEHVEALRAALFPGFFGVSDATDEALRSMVEVTLERVRAGLGAEIRRSLCAVSEDPHPNRYEECDARAGELVDAFMARLPDVQAALATDVDAAYTGDPAATSHAETILCYPGIRAITSYRIAHELLRLGVPLLPRIITEDAHSATGIDIHPGTQIGDHFFIDHGTGVVIGETAVIGRRVRIYQGVTLGAKSFPLDAEGHPIKGIPRHPIIEDDVTIYSGATVLGRITVGAGSVIGGNLWVTHDVPPMSRLSQAEPRQEHFIGGAGI